MRPAPAQPAPAAEAAEAAEKQAEFLQKAEEAWLKRKTTGAAEASGGSDRASVAAEVAEDVLNEEIKDVVHDAFSDVVIAEVGEE